MGHRNRALILLAAATAAGSCGDPIVVLGDAPGIARVVAGVGDRPGSAIDSLATRTRLTAPAAAAFDATSGLLYVADRGATRSEGGVTRPVGRILSVRSDGRLSVVVDRGGCSGNMCLESPHSLAVAPGGDLYVSDVVGHRIFRLRSGTSALEPVSGDGTPGHTPDGEPAAGARLAGPAGLAWVNGRLFFAEQAGHRVRTIETDGRLGTVAGVGEPGFSGDGAPAVLAQLSAPGGVSVSGSLLFIADRDNNRIRQVDLSTGRITTLAGTGAAGFAGDGANASAARLDRPASLAVSPDGGTLFVADQGNNRIRSIDTSSLTIFTFAGTGDPAFVPGPRQAGDISLLRPAGLATTATGFLFIADPGHAVVWRVTLGYRG